MSIVFNTAATANGYIADAEDSLDWLFAISGEHPDVQPFIDTVTALVVGSTTYEWVLGQTDLLAVPEKWGTFFGNRPMFVFTTRALDTPKGADVRFVSGDVVDHIAEIRSAAGPGTIWVQGGGDLAGQFLESGVLDEIVLSIAPVFLQGGRPLLPRDVYADKLTLVSAEKVGQFIAVRYLVGDTTRSP